jgi:hypothetical protein
VLRSAGLTVLQYKVDAYQVNDEHYEAYYLTVFGKNPNILTYIYLDATLGNVKISSQPFVIV